jgi:hypothetical protein
VTAAAASISYSMLNRALNESKNQNMIVDSSYKTTIIELAKNRNEFAEQVNSLKHDIDVIRSNSAEREKSQLLLQQRLNQTRKELLNSEKVLNDVIESLDQRGVTVAVSATGTVLLWGNEYLSPPASDIASLVGSCRGIPCNNYGFGRHFPYTQRSIVAARRGNSR